MLKVSMNVFVLLSLSIWMEQEKSLFHEYEHEKNIYFFSNIELKFNREPKT